jgi:hypothetical protein
MKKQVGGTRSEEREKQERGPRIGVKGKRHKVQGVRNKKKE